MALPACTYDNGPNDDGVGATLTANASALGAVGGVTLAAGAGTPVLVDPQAARSRRLYLPTALGGASAKC